MAVTKTRLFIGKGADFSKNFTVTDGSGLRYIKFNTSSTNEKSYDSSSVLHIYSTVVTGSSGIYKLVLSNSTASITSGRYVYDVELILVLIQHRKVRMVL